MRLPNVKILFCWPSRMQIYGFVENHTFLEQFVGMGVPAQFSNLGVPAQFWSISLVHFVCYAFVPIKRVKKTWILSTYRIYMNVSFVGINDMFLWFHLLLRPHGTMQGKARRAVVPFYNPL